ICNALAQRDALPDMRRLARQDIEKNHSWIARVDTLIRGVDEVLVQKNSNSASKDFVRIK
ncbi:MAG: hypothetical protein AAFN38_26055, partial [Cyanobacteria bacterium J06560_5]